METPVVLLIILGVIAGVSHGAGVLPDSLTAAVGETLTFNTTVTQPETPFMVVTWSFAASSGDDTTIITSSTEDIINPAYADRITLFRETGSLQLRNLSLTDSGVYKALLLPDGGVPHRGNCRLMIYAPVSSVFVTVSSTDLVEFNSSVRLSCSSSGSSVSFLWMNSSSEVTLSDRVQITDGGSTLTIVNVTRYDEGPFRCHVFNPVSGGTSDPVSLSISYGPENINLTVSPSQEYFEEGSDVSLSCSAVSRPAAVFKWFLNGAELPHTEPELRLRNIQLSQSGSYSCQAFNHKTLRSQTSQPSAVSVLAPVANIKVNTSGTEFFESSSSSVRLSCSSSGSSVSFQWMNSSSEVTLSDRVQITDGGSTLTIVNVTRYDEGPFRCHVFNPVSDGTSDPVNLLVIHGPENMNLTRSPSQELYDEGSDISLMCSVACSPAVFKWFLNGAELPHTGPELRLINIQMSQSGNYSCQVFNDRTMRNQTSQIENITVRKSEISNVMITVNATDVSEFSSVRLSCSSSGSFPNFIWMNSSSEVAASDRVQMTDKGSTLTIIKVSRYDQGPFVCHVFNNFSSGTSDPVKLSISFGPENTDLKLSPAQEYFEEGSDVSLSCSAVSRPAAVFKWFLNGAELPHTEPELRLRNIQLSQSGSYSCQAFNHKTLRSQTSQPSAITVQTAISNVMVSSNNTDVFEFSSSVRLSCSSSGSSVSFQWMNSSSEVTLSDRVQITDGGSTLTIVNVTRYDEGPFRCNVSNGVSVEISRPVNLFVQYGPDSVSIKGPDSVRVGDFIMLYCSSMSVPAARVTWLFNGKPANRQEAVYTIESSRSSDSGTYTCTAVNAVTGERQTVNHKLTVIDFSDCDCSAAAGRATIITAVCCLVIAAVTAVIVFLVIRRRRVKSNYPAHQKEKRSVKEVNSDLYKASGTLENELYSFPVKNK